MRGSVYRLGLRRAGSILLAVGAALALALGSGSAALAKARAIATHPTALTGTHPTVVGTHPPVVSARPPAKASTIAHATGHKIA
jgi:hypothetical protein